MKIYSKETNKLPIKATICEFKSHWFEGINRRDFVKGSLAISLLTSIAGCKPSGSENTQSKQVKLKSDIETVKIPTLTFNADQQLDLDAIFMQLFPDDGNGPSANDLNITTYLQWAMTDQRNIDDGDPEFIAKGIGWLNQLANDEVGQKFRDANDQQKEKLIAQTINSNAGKNWASILLYYVIEAITLDPFYGGNTNQVGWKWLEHQGGFPQPIAGKTYRDFS